MTNKAILLDTSFFLRLLNLKDPLFRNAELYYEYCLREKISLYISTISVAEFCAGGTITQLPMRDLRVLPFNLTHAIIAGKFAGLVHKGRSGGSLDVARILVPNDTKLFAQAEVQPDIQYYLTSDTSSARIYNFLKTATPLSFHFLDLSNSPRLPL